MKNLPGQVLAKKKRDEKILMSYKDASESRVMLLLLSTFFLAIFLFAPVCVYLILNGNPFGQDAFGGTIIRRVLSPSLLFLPQSKEEDQILRDNSNDENSNSGMIVSTSLLALILAVVMFHFSSEILPREKSSQEEDTAPCRSSNDERSFPSSVIAEKRRNEYSDTIHTLSNDGSKKGIPSSLSSKPVSSAVSSSGQDDQGNDLDHLIPLPIFTEDEEENESSPTPSILLPAEMHQLAHQIPAIARRPRWKRLYCLARDGDAFETCLNNIKNQQYTLIVLRTDKGDVMGGFADTAWNHPSHGNNNFFGGTKSCLFSVIKHEKMQDKSKPATNDSTVKVYNWTGSNQYMQLCDTARKRLAFGGGGGNSAFGLIVQDNFQTGSTGQCDTFNNDPLSEKESHFRILEFEIFGLSVW